MRRSLHSCQYEIGNVPNKKSVLNCSVLPILGLNSKIEEMKKQTIILSPLHFFLIVFLMAFLVVFLGENLQAQDTLQWSSPIPLTTGSTAKSHVVKVLPDGNPAVCWGQGSSIFFTKMMDGVFIEPIEVSTGEVNPDIYSFGGLDMAIKGNLIFIVYEDFSSGVFTVKSVDGGNNFAAPVNVIDPPQGKWATLPAVHIGRDGNPLVSVIFQNANETEARYIMIRSEDWGNSYGPSVAASEPADGTYVCECCPSDIYSEGEDVYLVFRNNQDNIRDMWISKSSNGGATFDQATDVDDSNWQINACPISGPEIAPLFVDSLACFWHSGAGGLDRVSISTINKSSMEKGQEFELPRPNPQTAQRAPTMAANDEYVIGIAWEENAQGETSNDVMFSWSQGNANDLSENVVNLTPISGSQKRPALAIHKEAFHLVYWEATGLKYITAGFPYYDMWSGGFARNLTVFEKSAGTWCSSCPGAELGFNEMIDNGLNVALINYHIDDDYETLESIERLDYYGINAHPTTIVDGILEYVGGDGETSMVDDFTPMLDQRNLEITQLGVFIDNPVISNNELYNELNAYISLPTFDEWTFIDLVLHVVLTESHIQEDWFFLNSVEHVVRQMYNGSSGIVIEEITSAGGGAQITMQIDSSFEMENLELIAFVQDKWTKEILNADKISLSEIPLGIPENQQFSIGPVPSNGQLNLSAPENVQSVGLYDMKGQKLWEREENSSLINMDLSSFPPGIYLLEVLLPNGPVIRKIVLN